MKQIHCVVISIATIAILMSLSGCQETGITGNSQDAEFGPLISVDQLAEILDDPSLVILDMGPEKELYAEKHIPGAIYVDWVDDITDQEHPERYMLIDQTTMQALIRRLGIVETSRVVIYDDLDNRVAMRMYWSLKYYGITRLQILDGTRRAWFKASKPSEKTARKVTPSEFTIANVSKDLSVDLDFVADRLQDPKVTLIDGRPVGQYCGTEPGKVFHTGALHEKRGHIPGAINIFWKDSFNEDGTFKSKEELEKLYDQATGSELVVTYCNEGLHAVPAWFVMSELLGHGNVRVYDNSLSEWANSDQPVEIEKEQGDR